MIFFYLNYNKNSKIVDKTFLFIQKRRIFLACKAFLKGFSRLIQQFFALVFAKRQIMFVTNQKIKTINLGPLLQICLMVVISWIISLFYSSIEYNKIISKKSEEISRLEAITSYYDTEFDNINDKLNKVSDYMSSVIPVPNQKDKKKKSEQSFKIPPAIKKIRVSDREQEIIEKMQLASVKMKKINKLTNHRLNKIEAILAKTGLKIRNSDLKITSSFKEYEKEYKKNRAVGGPYIPLQGYSAREIAIKNLSEFKLLDTAKFVDKVERLMSLEKMTRFIPFSRPMKNEHISSSFGPRIDPITKGMAMHQGIDFVGSKNQEVISPSIGTVIAAGKFHDYGYAVILDHGYGITTRYGHLSKVLVKKGQTVKKGQSLGLQGSTGRSTGDHLHYEVRYHNRALNPKNFIKAGDLFFKSNTLEAIIELDNSDQTT